MKLSEITIAILQNFQTINQSILVRKGSVISTLSPEENMFGYAKVTEEFSKDFCIYDLSRFLGLLSLSKDSDIQFEDKYCLIKQQHTTIKYQYCEPSLIIHPPDKEMVLPDLYCKIHLTKTVLQNTIKGMQILGFNELLFTGDGKDLYVETANTKNLSADNFKTKLGETPFKFTAIIEANKLKLIPSDYIVNISKSGLVHMQSDIVSYWIALQDNSTFE